jgi:hypothetical protein
MLELLRVMALDYVEEVRTVLDGLGKGPGFATAVELAAASAGG